MISKKPNLKEGDNTDYLGVFNLMKVVNNGLSMEQIFGNFLPNHLRKRCTLRYGNDTISSSALRELRKVGFAAPFNTTS